MLCYLNFQELLILLRSSYKTNQSTLHASKIRDRKDTSILLREAARTSIVPLTSAKSIELKHTFKLIRELTYEIDKNGSEITYNL